MFRDMFLWTCAAGMAWQVASALNVPALICLFLAIAVWTLLLVTA